MRRAARHIPASPQKALTSNFSNKNIYKKVKTAIRLRKLLFFVKNVAFLLPLFRLISYICDA